MEVSNVGGSPEVGALALRLFRNDQTVSAEKWLPWYYEEDNLRTTVMISGLPVNQPVPMEYTLTVPETMQEGEEMRFVINLDSAQPTPVPDGTITVAESRTSEIVLRVGKKCKSICCWWRDLWN